MLQPNGGGSSDEVIFKMGVVADPAARGVFDSLRKEHEALRQQYAKPIVMAAPITSGGYSIGGPGAGVGSTPVSFTGGPNLPMGLSATGFQGLRKNTPIAPEWQAAVDAMNYERMSVSDRVMSNVLKSAYARRDAVDARAEGWQRRQDAADNFWRKDPAMSGMVGYQAGNWHGGGEDDEQRFNKVSAGARQAVEGVSNLVRSFTYLGVSSEASLEKAVRGLAKVEAAGAGVRGVMSLASLAGMGGPAGAAVGVGVVAGVAGFSYLNGSQDRRRAQQDAELQAIQDDRLRQSQDEYNAFLRQDETLAGYGRTDDRRTERTTYGITSAGRRGDRASLVEARDRASFWAESYSNGPIGVNGFDTDGSNAAAEAVRYRKEELAATQELARIDEARARDNVEAAQVAVRGLERQLQLEESRVRFATNRQESGAAAYGMMSNRERSQFNAAYEKHQGGGVLSQNEITVLGRGDPGAARDAAIRRGNVEGKFGDTQAGRDSATRVTEAEKREADIRGRLGEPGGATGAYADAQTAASDLEKIRGQAQERVDGIVNLIFDAMDRLEERIEARQRTRDGLATLARP